MIVRSNWRELMKPKRLEVDERSLTPTYGKFFGEPFERGYAITVGNAIRRVLLSSLQGASVVGLRINGVLHEFSTVAGVTEDVTDIVLNLKEVRVKLHDGATEEVAHLRVKGPAGGDRRRHPGRAERGDPEPESPHRHARQGRRPRHGAGDPARPRLRRGERNKREDDPVGTIPIDAIFSPVTKVNFTVTNARVGQRTDYDRLRLEVHTDGSVRPEDAGGLRRAHPAGPAQHLHQLRGRRLQRRGGGRRRDRAEREPAASGRRARALGALRQLPPERRHPLPGRARAEDRAGDAQDQELRAQVAERDQGSAPGDGAPSRHAGAQLCRPARSSTGAGCSARRTPSRMRHRVAGKKLGRSPAHRRALFRNLVTELLDHEIVRTTGAKAKELRRWGDA
jgi:hypothetical protein